MSIFFKNILCRICNSAILAGVIIFFIGAYYCVIKAGETLIKTGFVTASCSSLVRLILWAVFR